MPFEVSLRKILSHHSPAWRALCAGLASITLGTPAITHGQQPEPVGTELARIDADYQRQRARLDRERIERLTRLAESQKGGEAELTYLEVFRFAIATDHYADAEPAAERVIRTGATTREVAFLAQLVNIIAEADRGDYDGSMRDLKAYLAATPARPAAAAPAQTRTVLAIGEAYYRRLVRGRRFDLAREVCDVVGDRAADPAIREHFSGYRKRLDLVGRAAPSIRGADADGAPVRLDDLKGKVVLVVFWATWCAPCVEKLPVLSRALELHAKDGFAVLGVNLDSGPDRERQVRRFVVDFGVPWPSVLNGEGESDVAAKYAVAEIPANVLVGRDGNVVTIDLQPANFMDNVAGALGRPVEAR
jgi:thiol-disulfide isomerase/thioredoxin